MAEKQTFTSILTPATYLAVPKGSESTLLGTAVFHIDPVNQQYVAVNQAAEIVFGLPQGQLMALSEGIDRIHIADRPILLQQIIPHAVKFLRDHPAAGRKELVFSQNLRVRDAAGRYITVLLKSKVVELSPGAATIFSSAIDITGFNNSSAVTYIIESYSPHDQLQQEPVLLFKKNYYSHKELADLTDREAEVLQYICEGCSSKQIAHLLGLSIYTVNNHRKNILRKTGKRTISGLVKYMLEHAGV